MKVRVHVYRESQTNEIQAGIEANDAGFINDIPGQMTLHDQAQANRLITIIEGAALDYARMSLKTELIAGGPSVTLTVEINASVIADSEG
jgi:hypothetical protein